MAIALFWRSLQSFLQIRCRHCGAPEPIADWGAEVRCPSCQATDSLSDPVRERLSHHRQRLGEIENSINQSRARLAKSKAIAGGWGMAYGIGANLGMVGGGATVLIAGMVRNGTPPAKGWILAGVAAGTILFVAAIVLWNVWMNRRSRVERLPTWTIGSCPSCRAELVCVVGDTTSCPFCMAELTAGLGSLESLEKAALELARVSHQNYAQTSAARLAERHP